MKDTIKTIPNSNGINIKLINRSSDPAMWIINVYKKILFFNVKKSSHWFTNEAEAIKFATGLKS
ncbi:MAG: hypothetical protein LH629_01200 [Ignavibacteria bacterium]|nr:hypothetical protein [Ignavibacteria bacterium]